MVPGKKRSSFEDTGKGAGLDDRSGRKKVVCVGSPVRSADTVSQFTLFRDKGRAEGFVLKLPRIDLNEAAR
jgi:hypothetical protein